MIKLVYDNWENNIPIPNGVKNKIGLNKIYFDNEINGKNNMNDLLNAFIKVNCEIKNIKLEEADENSLYIIYHHCLLTEMLHIDEWVLLDEVVEKIKNKNLKIIFLNMHESFDNIEFELKELQQFINKKNLPEKNFYVLNNNSKLYDIKNKLKTDINVFKLNWLIEYMNTTNLKDIKLTSIKKFMFLLHNRVPKIHRISLLILLKKFNLLKENIIDWSLTYKASDNLDRLNFSHSMTKTGLNHSKTSKNFIDFNSKEYRPFYKEFIMTTKLSYYEQNKNWFDYKISVSHDSANYNEIKSFEQSYINIITESHYSEADIHISEKTYRPFYCFQIPIFLASYKHIFKLREEHPELYLFDDLIDHSYDDEIDNTKRLLMIANEIKRLSEMRDTIETYYIKNETKFIENRKYIESYSNNNSTLNYFKSLVKNDTI